MFDDFLKIWVALDGPDHILSWAAEKNRNVQWEGRFAHHCDSCRFMYTDPDVRAAIAAHWEEVADDVLFRFAAITSPPAHRNDCAVESTTGGRDGKVG